MWVPTALQGCPIHRASFRAMGGIARILLATVALSLAITARAQTCVTTPDKYNLKPDGTTLNTTALQRYIDDVAQRGAPCVVWLRPGTYRTGALFLKSNTTLHLEKGVTLLGSQNIADYPERPTRVAGIEMTWPSALLNVYQQHNVIINGEGTIDGDGKVFWDSYWALRKIDDPKGLRWASDYDSKRPRLLVVYESSNVQIGSNTGHAPADPPTFALQLRRSGFWTVQLVYSHDVTVDGVTIRNNLPELGKAGHGPSTDGIDIDSSRHILVAHADIENNDDAICLKAGRDADGLRVNRATEDVVIRDSIIREGAAGVTFGSETSGGFRNIEIYNLHVLAGAPAGILFKSAPARGGFAENIRIHDLVLEGTPAVLRMTMNWNPNYSTSKIPAGLTDYPAYYKVLTTPVSPEQGLEHVHDIHIWNIKATGAKMVFDVNGNPAAPILRFQLDHFDVTSASAGHISNARDWTFRDMNLHIADGSSVALTDTANITGLPQSGKPSDTKSQAPHKYED